MPFQWAKIIAGLTATNLKMFSRRSFVRLSTMKTHPWLTRMMEHPIAVPSLLLQQWAKMPVILRNCSDHMGNRRTHVVFGKQLEQQVQRRPISRRSTSRFLYQDVGISMED